MQRCSWWVPALRGERFFSKYDGPSGGSPLSGGGIIILRVIRRHFLAAAMDLAVSVSTHSTLPMEGWVPALRGERFFSKYDGPSGGSPLSGGGIIILRVIRRHFLAAAMDLAVSVSTHSTLPMEVGR